MARLSTSTVFTDIDGNPFDPDTVTFKWKPPGGETVTKTHGEDAEVTKNDVGDYHVDVELDTPGKWFYRIEGVASDDSLQGADEGSLQVNKSQI
ncbi:MAG: hypothetical protein ACOC9Z_08020 [Chloroflexota bacterium]